MPITNQQREAEAEAEEEEEKHHNQISKIRNHLGSSEKAAKAATRTTFQDKNCHHEEGDADEGD